MQHGQRLGRMLTSSLHKCKLLELGILVVLLNLVLAAVLLHQLDDLAE